jgi:uncharacterized OB-fold protein
MTETNEAQTNEAQTNEAQTNEAQTNDFLASTCGNCGAELVGNVQSPDESLCCDCYRYNNDDNDYVEN